MLQLACKKRYLVRFCCETFQTRRRQSRSSRIILLNGCVCSCCYQTCTACFTWARVEKGAAHPSWTMCKSTVFGVRPDFYLWSTGFEAELPLMTLFCILHLEGSISIFGSSVDLVWVNLFSKKIEQSFYSVVDSSPEKPFKWGGWVIYRFIIPPFKLAI